jgi:hypothetical protein
LYRSGEERLVQEVVKTVVLVQDRRGEACTGGGVRPVQEVVRKSPLPLA